MKPEEKEQKNKFYITTAIAYASRKPHIGNVYEAILTDAVARFHRLRGEDVFFLTGTDEHGQKIERKAMEKGVTPQAYVDEIVRGIKEPPHGRSPFRRAAGTEAADRPRPPVFHTRARACGPAKASARQAPAS